MTNEFGVLPAEHLDEDGLIPASLPEHRVHQQSGWDIVYGADHGDAGQLSELAGGTLDEES